MPAFNALAAVVGKGKRHKPLTDQEHDLWVWLQLDLVARIDELIEASPLNQADILKKAGLSVEMLRKWRELESSPTLRSLVVLTNVLSKLPVVALAEAGAVPDLDTTLPETEDGAMGEKDDLGGKMQSLSQRDQGRVEGYIDALAGKSPPVPPVLTEPPSVQPGQKK